MIGWLKLRRVFFRSHAPDEKYTYPREYLLNNLVILFGGRVAEELVLEQTTTGAGNDIEKATDLARRMVCEWGMSEKLGPMTFGKKEEEIFRSEERRVGKECRSRWSPDQ